jgi:hypothetical protein
VKADFEHLEECGSLRQLRSSSAVTDTVRMRQKQANETAATKSAHRTASCCMLGTCCGGSTCPKFRAGFKECERETRQILGQFDDVGPSVSERLSTHLTLRLESLGNQSSCSDLQVADSTHNTTQTLPSASPSVLIQTSTGFTLLPTKLPNGDLAFVIPAQVKKSVASRSGNEYTRNFNANCGHQCVEQGKRLQDGDVWRPWWNRNTPSGKHDLR